MREDSRKVDNQVPEMPTTLPFINLVSKKSLSINGLGYSNSSA